MADEKRPEYLERGKDGVLRVKSPIPYGARYSDPGEAVRMWHRGELRFGCTVSVFRGYASHACGNTAKHDPDVNGNLTKCGHHSADAKARKKAKRDARHREWQAKWDKSRAVGKLNAERGEIIQKIADGHNDPRGLCADWLERKRVLEDGQ